MVIIDKEKCIACGRCVRDCVAENIRIEEKASIVGECIRCGHCVAICPTNCVSIPEYDMEDVEEQDDSRLEPVTLLSAIKQRRSIRQYESRKVEQEKLDFILQAGRYSATGSNKQGCRFVFVQEGLGEFKDVVWNAVGEANASGKLPKEIAGAFQNFAQMRQNGKDYLFREAPAVIVVAAESTVDAALAAQSMELAAVSQGLGVLYNGFMVYAAALMPEIGEWLDCKDKPVAVCMLLGYPKVTYQRSAPRKAADARFK